MLALLKAKSKLTVVQNPRKTYPALLSSKKMKTE